MNTTIFWGMALCTKHVNRCFGVHNDSNFRVDNQRFSTLKMVICSHETPVHILTTQRYTPEDDSIHNYRCENLKSYTEVGCYRN
jgi:hypothetical protein